MKDMMSEGIFFADTYALIGVVGGNINYKQYTETLLVTSQFNLIELYYYFLRNYDRETAERYLTIYSRQLVPITKTSIVYGMQFKLEHRKEKLSYVDCIGYALALELGIRFLTGDEKFEQVSNVEFIK